MWVMRSAMKPVGTKSEGRNLVLMLIPLWKPASSIVTTASKLSQENWMPYGVNFGHDGVIAELCSKCHKSGDSKCHKHF
jgi:predicted nucleic acid binding AN1-type Zn finger protein